MDNNGWIKLHRKTLDNPIICKDADYFTVWGYLLLSATHKKYDILWKGEKITLNPGQLITGRKSISNKFNISESKVQRILKKYENEQQIEQQTSNQNRLITINNWYSYQQNEQQNEQPVNNHRTTSEQPVNTNKNVNNENNAKNENLGKTKRFQKPLINDIKEYCKERNNKIDAEQFFNWYESKGWYIGKNKMKDWKAAIRTWEQREKKNNTGRSTKLVQ